MGLFDSIRRVVGGGDGTAGSDDAATQPDLVDTRDLDVAALRERASGVAGEVAVLDFSLSSLEQFDDAIDAGYDEELVTSDEPGTYATDAVRFGCYLGEVLVRVYGGEWTRNPDWSVTISGPDGTTTVAIFDVAERSITTGAVFAAVADRAVVEVGLDGVAAKEAVDSGDPEPSGDGPAVDDERETPSGDDSVAGLSSDAEPQAEGPAPDPATDEHTDVPDPVAADPALSEADRAVDDAESLIEEAEPETAAGDAAWAGEQDPPDDPATAGEATEPAPQASDGPPIPGGSESLSGAETASEERTDHDASPSLFDDTSAGAGPTVDDAPSANDGPPVGTPGSEPDDAHADEPDHDGVRPGETDSGDPADDHDSGDPGTATPDPDPAADDGLRATHAEAADELVSFWTEYDLDYTPESLARLDELVSAEWDDDRFDDADFDSDDTFDDRVFTSVSLELGSYFGEVLVRELDAEWSDETATDGVVVEGADGPLAIPVLKVAGTSLKQQPVFARSYDSLLADLEPDA